MEAETAIIMTPSGCALDCTKYIFNMAASNVGKRTNSVEHYLVHLRTTNLVGAQQISVNIEMENNKGTTRAFIPYKSPTIEQLEEILHEGQLSCNHVDEVWPNLFLGDMYMSHDRYGLWRLGITHVLNAAHGKMCCKGSDDFYGTTVKYYGVAANDLPTFDMSLFFYPSSKYIHQALSTAGAKIFVHCAVGVSRSAALVLAYLMIYHNYTLVDAILKVKEKRWIFPNCGFLRQLITLDCNLQSKSQNE